MRPVMDQFESKISESLIRRGFAPFVPVKDDGVDFLALHRASGGTVRLQVKGSKEHAGGGWYTPSLTKIGKSQADFFIFVWPRRSTRGRFALDEYLIVPTMELQRRAHAPLSHYPTQKLGSGKIWFYFQRHGQSVFDLAARRPKDVATLSGTLSDYSLYFRNWDQVVEFCNRQRQRKATG